MTPANAGGAAGHTPGPWKTRAGHPRTILGADGIVVATTNDGPHAAGTFWGTRRDAAIADARLIAAAPALLAACEAVLRSHAIAGKVRSAELAQVSAALAQARGGA